VSKGSAHTGWLGVVIASGDMWPRVAPFWQKQRAGSRR